MRLQLGEVVPIRIRFHQAAGSKIRPALVLLDPGDDDFVPAPITSQARMTGYDVAIDDWRAAGLNVESTVRVHKLAVLAKSEVVRTLGVLCGTDRRSLIATLCTAFCPRDGA